MSRRVPEHEPEPVVTGRSAPTAFDPRLLSRTYEVAAIREQRVRTLDLLDAGDGHAVLDVGCGPGHLMTDLAVRSTGAQLLGVDRQDEMLAAARSRAEDVGVQRRVAVVRGDATDLPLPDAAFDRAAVVQVLAYVPAVERALSELHRVLVPGGRAVLIDTDWRSCVWHADDGAATEHVLRLWEDHFVHPRLPAAMPGFARAAGFSDVQVHGLPILETDTSVDTYSVGMAAVIAGFVGKRDSDVATAWRADVLRQAAAGTYFFALTRFATVVMR